MIRYRVILSVALSVGTVVGCASGPPSYRQSVLSAVQGDGFVTIERRNGTVILRGTLEDKVSEGAVLRAARAGEGVTRVINYIHIDYD